MNATKQKQLERSAALVCRFNVRNTNLLRTKCPDYLTKDQWTPNSSDLNSLVIPWLGQRWRLSQASSKAEDDRRTPGNAADDLGQPAAGTDRQSCKEVSKVTEDLCWSWGWTFCTFSVTVEFWRFVAVVWMTLLTVCLLERFWER